MLHVMKEAIIVIILSCDCSILQMRKLRLRVFKRLVCSHGEAVAWPLSGTSSHALWHLPGLLQFSVWRGGVLWRVGGIVKPSSLSLESCTRPPSCSAPCPHTPISSSCSLSTGSRMPDTHWEERPGRAPGLHAAPLEIKSQILTLTGVGGRRTCFTPITTNRGG